MIRFKNLPIDESVLKGMIDSMTSCNIDREDATRMADEATSITIALLRQLDDMIDKVASNEDDRSVIQQLVLKSLVGTASTAMEMNAMDAMVTMILGLRRR